MDPIVPKDAEETKPADAIAPSQSPVGGDLQVPPSTAAGTAAMAVEAMATASPQQLAEASATIAAAVPPATAGGIPTTSVDSCGTNNETRLHESNLAKLSSGDDKLVAEVINQEVTLWEAQRASDEVVARMEGYLKICCRTCNWEKCFEKIIRTTGFAELLEPYANSAAASKALPWLRKTYNRCALDSMKSGNWDGYTKDYGVDGYLPLHFSQTQAGRADTLKRLCGSVGWISTPYTYVEVTPEKALAELDNKSLFGELLPLALDRQEHLDVYRPGSRDDPQGQMGWSVDRRYYRHCAAACRDRLYGALQELDLNFDQLKKVHAEVYRSVYGRSPFFDLSFTKEQILRRLCALADPKGREPDNESEKRVLRIYDSAVNHKQGPVPVPTELKVWDHHQAVVGRMLVRDQHLDTLLSMRLAGIEPEKVFFGERATWRVATRQENLAYIQELLRNGAITPGERWALGIYQRCRVIDTEGQIVVEDGKARVGPWEYDSVRPNFVALYVRNFSNKKEKDGNRRPLNYRASLDPNLDILLPREFFNKSREDVIARAKIQGCRLVTPEANWAYAEKLLKQERDGTINEAGRTDLKIYRERYVRDKEGGVGVLNCSIWHYSRGEDDKIYPVNAALLERGSWDT